MVYYKVTCMEISDSYYVGLSTYDNNFVLHDIEHVDVIRSGWGFLGFGKSHTEIKYDTVLYTCVHSGCW